MNFVVEDVESLEPTEGEKSKPNLKRKNKTFNKNKHIKKSKNDLTTPIQNDFKISRAELYKPPTAEELNQLRETEILFNSNLFRLQTEELLKEISFKEKKIKLINDWIEKFKKFTETLPNVNFKLSEVGLVFGENETKKMKNLKEIIKNFPINDIKCDQDCIFNFSKPLNVETTGLFNINALSKPNFELTLNVVAPKSCFHERDYMNSRYLVKKCLYLSVLTVNLRKSNIFSKVNYDFDNGNKFLPLLQIQTNEVKDTIFNVQIIPEENTFKMAKFLPEKSNLRTSYISSMFDESLSEEIATPFYNSVHQRDLVLLENDKFNLETLKGLKGACEGLILLKIWLKQRGLLKGYGNFTDNILYSFVTYLVKKGKINKHMSSYQVIRNVWSHLANSTWDTTGISLSDSPYDLEIFHKYFDVVFIDCTGKYNLVSTLDKNIYIKVKNEAKLAIKFLDEAKFNSFQSLFITKMPNYLQYDALIQIENDEEIDKIFTNMDVSTKFGFINFSYPLVLKKIIANLKQGLSDRIEFITPLTNFDTKFEIGDKYNDKQPICIGLNLNYFNLFKVIEKGPPTYEPEAKVFRDFWGKRSELRRFKDGSITEAVYWPATTIYQKRNIFKEIVNYVLEEKMQLKKFNILSDQFDYSILKFHPQTNLGLEEANLKIINSFDELGKILRNLKLQLGISSVQGISESFSYSDPFPPIPTNYIGGKKITFSTETNIFLKENHNFGMVPKYVAPIEGILQMALHSKWPNDYNALCNLKTAFYLEISKKLLAEHGIKSNPKSDFLDVLFNGLVFRFSIFHPKQIIELKKIVDETGVISYEENDLSVFQEQKYLFLPKVIGALNGIHAQFPSFGSSTALIKRWLNSQLLDDFLFPNIVINLLNASVYLNSSPFEQPALPQVAFLRFLHLLANYDWNLQPVVINFNNEITREQLDEHESYFHRNRSQFSPLHIITPFDNFKSILTKKAPTTVILNRLKILSFESISIIEKNINSKTLFDSKVFFTPNLSGYNVIIHLRPLLNPRRHQDINFSDENTYLKITEYEKRDNEKIPVVDFNPVDLYLKELRSNYDDFALFFHDTYGGNIITVIWKPIIYEEEEFKINQVSGRFLINDGKIKVNVDAIIEDFYILGEGLVRTIETR